MTNVTDPWIDQKWMIGHFYKSCFNIVIDWSVTLMPEYDPELPILEYAHVEFNCSYYVDSFKKNFGEKSVASNPQSQEPDNFFREKQDRPKDNYCFAWGGFKKPNLLEHFDRGYLDFCANGNKYMVPKEGLIAVSRIMFEKSRILHLKGMLSFCAIDDSSDVLAMDCHNDILTMYFIAPGCPGNPCRVKLPSF